MFADDVFAMRRPMNFGSAASAALVDRQRAPADALTPEDETFVRWLLERAELDARAYKPETLHRRVPACLRAIRASTTDDARRILERTPALIPAAIDTLIIGVTGFFRDPQVFDYLARQVIPAMSDSGGALRIWSVGCSDGSELYSLAMLLAEQRILHRCYLLGTDCRADAIRRAATGAYDTAAVRGVPTGLLQRYFTFSGRDWRLHGWLRTAVQFRTANVLKIMEPGLFDLVLCRNMAIYLESDAVLQLWSGLEHSLRTGGVLVLGKAERPIGAKRLSAVAPCVYRRTRG